ncbi:unnamed protein product (macronuclear) [Paramecium tetraurelia]|uniref:Myb-like DNA-binding domain containing protein n=1 Tax=Paramecium tetraurelia TaxID=5888 RepID=A0BX37_PARTE|nr:uncharacterized protein GSPATT00032956001 [Paramecium tetraurelia]CAK63104.1 unnamed protein product [Paramecium tetraurelia]|eukprot:XP_001430502.1 hypothetical protein (macronuclear) [Paramecium tetraurelia strain d4-2]
MIKKRISKDQNNCQKYKNSNKSRKYWTEEEDNILKSTVQLHGSDWKLIAEYLDGRNASQCAQRWKRVKPDDVILNFYDCQGEKNQKWTPEEDEEVKRLTKEYRFDWKVIARFLSNRTGRQIRERYINHLDPHINTKAWSQQEDLKIWTLYKKIGSRWSEMAKKLRGRPENMIKNRFYGYIRKNYAKQENPYYIVPNQRRQLTKEDDQVELLQNQNTLETGIEDIEPQIIEQIQQNKSIQQQEEQSQSGMHSILQSLQSDKPNFSVISNLHDAQQLEQFHKMFIESSENEFAKLDHLPAHFSSIESHIHSQANSHNQFNYTPRRDEENDNFLNQFLQVDGSCMPVAMRADIFEEFSKFSQLEY